MKMNNTMKNIYFPLHLFPNAPWLCSIHFKENPDSLFTVHYFQCRQPLLNANMLKQDNRGYTPPCDIKDTTPNIPRTASWGNRSSSAPTFVKYRENRELRKQMQQVRGDIFSPVVASRDRAVILHPLSEQYLCRSPRRGNVFLVPC